MTERRCVVLGDVVDSRAQPDRGALREHLDRALGTANEELSGSLTARFDRLKGVDEVGGVLRDPSLAYRAIRLIAEGIHPTEMRFGVAWGEVDVGLSTGDIAAMDGPAFHDADREVARAEAEGRYVALSVKDCGHLPEVAIELLADHLDLLLLARAEWTERQAEIVQTYREAGTMVATAERLGVSQQAVSKTIDRAGVQRIDDSEETVNAMFAAIADDVRDEDT